MNLREALGVVRSGGELDVASAEHLFGALFDGGLLDGAVSNGAHEDAALEPFLVALADRGERSGEIAGAARALRQRMVPFEHDPAAIDTCGTGGDGLSTFNLSTAAALVAAAAGAKVVKHGNRQQSSRCGSADLLEAAGLPLDLAPRAARAVLDEVGITFLMAPLYHPVMARVAAVRRRIGRRTIFNWLGPLCNPGRVRGQMIGVATAGGVELVARALQQADEEPQGGAAGARRALIVHGAGGADELTLAGANRVLGVNLDAPALDAAVLGLAHAPVAALAGGDAATNVRLFRSVLDSERSPVRDAVRLNAAAALCVAGLGPAHEALARATEALDSGAARTRLERWIESARRARGGS